LFNVTVGLLAKRLFEHGHRPPQIEQIGNFRSFKQKRQKGRLHPLKKGSPRTSAI